MQTQDWFSTRPKDMWYVLVREGADDAWTAKTRFDKGTAEYVVSQHLQNGEEAVLGFGRPFAFFP
jgi:hypothetical protein